MEKDKTNELLHFVCFVLSHKLDIGLILTVYHPSKTQEGNTNRWCEISYSRKRSIYVMFIFLLYKHDVDVFVVCGTKSSLSCRIVFPRLNLQIAKQKPPPLLDRAFYLWFTFPKQNFRQRQKRNFSPLHRNAKYAIFRFFPLNPKTKFFIQSIPSSCASGFFSHTTLKFYNMEKPVKM